MYKTIVNSKLIIFKKDNDRKLISHQSFKDTNKEQKNKNLGSRSFTRATVNKKAHIQNTHTQNNHLRLGTTRRTLKTLPHWEFKKKYIRNPPDRGKPWLSNELSNNR